jgi:hypothetical protein
MIPTDLAIELNRHTRCVHCKRAVRARDEVRGEQHGADQLQNAARVLVRGHVHAGAGTGAVRAAVPQPARYPQQARQAQRRMSAGENHDQVEKRQRGRSVDEQGAARPVALENPSGILDGCTGESGK